MEKFKIPITVRMSDEIEVEAESLDEAVEAIELAEFDSDKMVLNANWELVEGSVETDFEMVEILNPGHKLSKEPYPSENPEEDISEEPHRRELEAKDFGIVDKEPQKIEEVCDDEERESRRHLDQLGEGYEQDSEDEGGDEEG